MKILKLALFDLDGTLIDTEKQYTEIYGTIAKKFRPDIPNLEKLHKGMSFEDILRTYYPDSACHEEIKKMVREGEIHMVYKFFDGVEDFVSDLRSNGIKCAIVTSSSRLKMEYVKRDIPQLNDLFDKIFTSEDVVRSKPNPDCYLNAMRFFDCEPHECIIFEDALIGIEAGMNAGIYTVGIAGLHPLSFLVDKCNMCIGNFKSISYSLLKNRFTNDSVI